MGDSEGIEISPSSTEYENKKATTSTRIKVEDGTPLIPMSCVKKNMDMKLIEEKEDCFILDYNPFDSVDISMLSLTNDADDVDLSVLAEKGKVACRDYPHSRHLCLQFPFDTTRRDRHCDLCYCYVCDSAAPCEYWLSHCHASEDDLYWKSQRDVRIKKARFGN